jgi:hypothetical protein
MDIKLFADGVHEMIRTTVVLTALLSSLASANTVSTYTCTAEKIESNLEGRLNDPSKEIRLAISGAQIEVSSEDVTLKGSGILIDDKVRGVTQLALAHGPISATAIVMMVGKVELRLGTLNSTEEDIYGCIPAE